MITKERILKSVEIVSGEEKTANVLWLDQIIEDGLVISSIPHRGSYIKEEKDRFIAEVEGGWDYISLLQW